MEVDSWTAFTNHFTHIKSGDTAPDKILLLTAILSDAVNLGLVKMADSCPGTTYAKLAWLQAWHIRDDTYADALSELVNAQYHHPLLPTGAMELHPPPMANDLKPAATLKLGG